MTTEELALGARIRALITGVLGSATWEGGGGGGGSAPIASSTVTGTVKTDVDQVDPIVYTKTTDDSLLAGKAAAVHTHAGTDIVSGLVAAARLAAHDIISAHSAAGLSVGNVIRAATATTFAFAQLAFADIGSPPTTLAGYGITDAAPIVHTHAAADIVSGQLALARGGTGVDGSGGLSANFVFAAPGGGAGAAAFRALVVADIPTHDIIAKHSASGLTAGQVIRASGAATFAWSTLAFADLASKPTTLAGYGITDAAPLVHTHAAADVVSGRFVAARMLDGTNGFYFTGRGSGVDPVYASFVTVRLTADNAAIAAAVPTTALQVANLTQAANINEEWDLEWIIEIANSVATDVFVFNVTSTAGTLTGRYTVMGTNGVPNTGAGVEKRWSMPAGTITVANANAPGATGTIGLVVTVTIRARVKLTVANGTIQLLLRAGTNAAASSGTATVKAQSQLIATRIA